jgi:hypothetical protein
MHVIDWNLGGSCENVYCQTTNLKTGEIIESEHSAETPNDELEDILYNDGINIFEWEYYNPFCGETKERKLKILVFISDVKPAKPSAIMSNMNVGDD